MGYGRSKDAFEGALHAGYARLNKRITNFFWILIKKSEATACPGDSGGPLLSSYKGAGGVKRGGIIGVVHGGESSQCRPGEWAAYTRLQESVALSFITTNVPGVGLQ
jgi:secreted trypsin-like serine protease